MTTFIGFVISVLLGGLRVGGFKSQTFQAISHIWVGVLGTIIYFTGDRLVIVNLVAISVVETLCFLAGKFGGVD